jgi:hypothetical protein
MDVPAQDVPTVEVRKGLRGAWIARLSPGSGARPHWWLIQVRGDSGKWVSRVVRGTTREVPIAAAVDRVAVRAVDRASIEGPVQVLKLR